MTGLSLRQIRVITKLPNSEQSNKGKVKTHNYINRPNQSTTDKLSNILIFARLQIINRFFRSRRMTKIIHQSCFCLHFISKHMSHIYYNSSFVIYEAENDRNFSEFNLVSGFVWEF
jgi:hypothetical protein